MLRLMVVCLMLGGCTTEDKSPRILRDIRAEALCPTATLPRFDKGSGSVDYIALVVGCKKTMVCDWTDTYTPTAIVNCTFIQWGTTPITDTEYRVALIVHGTNYR